MGFADWSGLCCAFELDVFVFEAAFSKAILLKPTKCMEESSLVLEGDGIVE